MKLSDIAVIFDMDGVIFDSERACYNSFKEVCEDEGYPFIEQVYLDCIGVNLKRCQEIFEEAYGAEFDFAQYYALVRRKMRELRFDIKLGVHEIFAYIKEKQIPTALASSTREESVRRMLNDAGLLAYFDAIVCGDMVSHSKPHPEIFLTAAEKLGFPAEKCYVIEDSFNGIRCAHNAGMHPIMVPDILQPDEEIKGLAEVVLPSLTEVIDYIEGVV